MKKRGILSLICIAITTTLSGCNNPKAANKENFAKALSQYVAQNPYSLSSSFRFQNLRDCTLYLGHIPKDIVSYEPDDGSNMYFNQYNALKKSEILTSSLVKEKEVNSNRLDGRQEKQIVTKYDLSEQGRKIAKQDKNGNFYIPYCQVVFKEVNVFTEPADAVGAKVSQVDYTFVIEKIDDWVKNPEILQAYPEVKEVLDSVGKPIDAKKALVLTSEGWSTGEK